MKVFWSWQSDTPGKIGRHFVRDALIATIEQLKQTLEIEEPTGREARSAMHLDQDRKGIPGSPDLARVILEKIEQSAVFVADVTAVGITTTQKEGTQPKKVINPNVAIELGYALHALGDRALLMVMNEHYGSRVDLPFDLQSKAGPIIFRLPPDADRKTITAASGQLTAQLAEALELCITQHVESIRQQTPFREATAANNPAMYFEPNEALATADYPVERKYEFTSEKAMYLRLFPTYGDQPRVGLATLAPIFNQRRPRPMSAALDGIAARNPFGSIIYVPVADSVIQGLTQGFEGGELWGVTGDLFVPHTSSLPLPRVICVIPIIDFEKIYLRTLRNYVQVAASEMKLRLPYTVEAGAIGLNDVYLAAQSKFHGPMISNVIQKRYALNSISDDDIKLTLRRYFIDFYDLAACSREQLLSEQEVTAHDLPPR
jgi:hypothetical protein